MDKPISIYLNSGETEELKTNTKCDHSYLILLNDKLRRSQDDMTDEMKTLRTQNSELEYESDRMEKTVQNLRGISKNFIELNKLHKILNSVEKKYTTQLEAHIEYLRRQINNIFTKILIFVITDILMCVMFAAADVISLEHMTCTILLYASVIGFIYYMKYTNRIYELISPVDERLLRIRSNFSGDIATTKTLIKKINKSVDFLNDLVDLM